jgi:uncharacterized protein YqjF (DUF2071 family)
MYRDGDRVAYASRRRLPGPYGAATEVEVELGGPLEPDRLERFLTDRFTFYSRGPGGLDRTDVTHPPWRLRRARATLARDGLVAAAGLPEPVGEPLACFSEGTRAVFGRPRPAAVPALVRG